MSAAVPEFGPFEAVQVRGLKLEVLTTGSGPPLLFLHPGVGLRGALPFLNSLALSHRVIAPSHPGFGASELPDWMTSVDDLAYFYLDLLDEMNLKDATLIGASLGGWIATALAVKSTVRLRSLILLNSVGMKFGRPRDEEIADIFSLNAAELDRRLFHRAPTGWREYGALTDEDLAIVARNKESEALFGWSPNLHDPKLRRRTHRIDVPTLVLWGERDGIVSPDYGRALAATIPRAEFKIIAEAGHLPYVEKPAAAAAEVTTFAQGCLQSFAA